MDLTLFHPKVVHFPMALAVLMPFLAGGLLLAWWREWLPRRTWIIGVLFQVMLAVTSFAALQTGEIDEEIAEEVVSHDAIEVHEEAAEVFFWAVIAVLVLFVVVPVVKNERVATGVGLVALVGTLVVGWLGYRVGEAGGDLVYEHGAANAFIDGVAAGGSSGSHEDDDD